MPTPISARIVDLGCGNNKQRGAFGVDHSPGTTADLEMDLEKFPWPLAESSALIVYAIQVLEHLEDRVQTMEEIWRICQDGALVIISVPDGLCAGFAQDPTHKHPWNIGTFLYFCPDQFITGEKMPPYGFSAHFEIVDYHTRSRVRTPWGEQWYKDDLWVTLRVVKDGD